MCMTCLLLLVVVVVLFKQKTAYELRISDWSSDVCSSDLVGHCGRRNPLVGDFRSDSRGLILFTGPEAYVPTALLSKSDWAPTWNYAVLRFTIGRASCRERVCQSV